VRVVARAQLLASWTSALDAADAAADAAFRCKALDAAGRTECHKRLRAERDWLSRFEQESSVRFP
jgi:hypothetical protein